MNRETPASIAAWHRSSGEVICASTQAAAINERFAILMSEWVGPRRKGWLIVRTADVAIALFVLAESIHQSDVPPVVLGAGSAMPRNSASRKTFEIINAAKAGVWPSVDDALPHLLNALAALVGNFGTDLATAVTERMAVLRRESAEAPRRAAG